jgi:hypothetical protein
VTKNVLFLGQNCTLAKHESQSAFSSQKQHICCHKNVFWEKGHDQKTFGPLFWDSAYFSEAVTTLRMFGMICFEVDSQTHTV